MEVKVSIIMPVYNGEKFIESTIDSILRQDFKNFELIIINDGSNDRSLEIIKKCAEHDKRIVVINQDNMGICRARNIGIAKAKAEYIMFCDHDDIYRSGYLSAAYKEINILNVDFVKFGCVEKYINNDVVRKENVCYIDNKTFYDNEAVKELLLEYTKYNEYIWDAIYKKSIIEAVGGFDVSYIAGCEDIDFLLRVIQVADKVATKEGVYYEHYIRNASSTSRKYNDNTYKAVLKLYELRMKLMSGHQGYKAYCYYKSKALVWALLGMFSFKNCPKGLFEMAKEFKALLNNSYFFNFIETWHYSYKTKEDLALSLCKSKAFIVLAFLAYMKRRSS